MGNPRLSFLRKWRMQLFSHFSILWLYTTLYYRSSMSSNFLVFHTSSGISSRPTAFLFLIFLSATKTSSLVNYPSLMSCWLLIIFEVGFPSRFLKCSFDMCICFSWLAAFSLSLEVLFLLCISLTVCHAIWDSKSFSINIISKLTGIGLLQKLF